MVVKFNFSNETLFNFLAKELEACKTTKEVDALLKQFKRKNQEIESVFVSRKAVDLEIVRYDSVIKEYVYSSPKLEGITSFGNSTKDIETYLNNPNKGQVYAEIRQEVYKKFDI